MINIILDIFSRNSTLSKLYNDIEKKIRSGFKNMGHELDDHLEAINENTNEIQANYEYLCELENKLDKLAERIDQIQFFLQNNSNFVVSKSKNFEVRQLTKNEQEVFLALYTLEEEKGSLTYADIARKSALTESLVCNYITSIIEKGIPIIKRYVNNKPYFKLDKDFKRLQARENILKLEIAKTA